MSRRWRYRCCVAATLLALLVVEGCGFSDSGAGESQAPDEAPEALALVPEAAGTSTDGSLSSKTIDLQLDQLMAADESSKSSSSHDTPDAALLPRDSGNGFDPSRNGPAGLGWAGNVHPLTGRPAANADAAARPVLMMKVDNHPRARPQVGLDLADMVFDLRAEGVTRFAAVFQSKVPDPVGPVRSSRTSDFDLLRGFDQPLYGSSGGNANVAQGLRSLPIVELTNLTRREYFRNRSRPAPHNLFVNASDLYALAPDTVPAPQPWFTFGSSGRSPGSTAVPVTGPVTVSFRGSPVVTHTWDAGEKGWLRTQDGRPHITLDPVTNEEIQLAPENVVIMVTDYHSSPADLRSPEVRSTGTGPLLVLSDGQAVAGSWRRDSATDPLSLMDVDGQEIVLTAGRTWVLMPESGQVTLPDGVRPPGWTR